jgi:Mn-dependent DtxR family transcriptional regulator
VPETLETADDIRTIRYKIESIESTQHLLLRERAPQLLSQIMKLFEGTDKLAEVYLAVNRERSQADIVDYLNARGVRVSQPTVSRRMATLEQEGLIEKVGSGERGVAWGKKGVVEKLLRLSYHLERGPQ